MTSATSGNGAEANGAPGSTRMGATNGSHHNTTFSDPIFLDDADDHITNDPDPIVADPDPIDEQIVNDPGHDPDPELGCDRSRHRHDRGRGRDHR